MVILIVGDGDFSFTKGIVKYIPSESRPKITSSCYESHDEVIKKYSQASDNISFIKHNGISVVTGVDATKLSKYNFGCQFSLIIFNFPHVGGKSNIKNNRKLLAEFFQSIKESRILVKNGLVCVSLCQGQAGTEIDLKDRIFANSWQIQEMAARSDFVIYDVRQFDTRGLTDYIPTGFRSQEKRFRLEGARTYVFQEHMYPLVNDHTELLATIELRNRKYWAPCWLADCLNDRDEVCIVSRQISASLVQSLVEEGLTSLDWQHCPTWICADDTAYWLLDAEQCDISEAVEQTLLVSKQVLGDAANTHIHLCSSPWQQVVMVIDDYLLESTGHLFVVTHGDCYIRSPEPQSTQYVVTIELLATDNSRAVRPEAFDAETHLDIPDVELVQRILSQSKIKLLEIRRETLQAGMWPAVEAILSCDSSRQFRAVVVDISSFIRHQTALSIDRAIWNADSDASHALHSVFPTSYSVAVEPTLCASLQSITSEHFRLVAVQNALESGVYRDMSFWWGGDHTQVDMLLARVSEVCRCVFRVHFGGPVELLEQYEPTTECSGNRCSEHHSGGRHWRSLCIRMFLRAHNAPLSKATINQLQSAVRQHCEHLFDIQLR